MPRPYYQNNQKKLEEIIRVDHAGEFGAKRIYEGQINHIKNADNKKLIKNMLDQEAEHLEYFDNKIKNGDSRPTVLMPLWNVCGYLLGATSARLGYKSAMLVTEQIEQVIVDHYSKQIEYLEKSNYKGDLLKKIKKFRQDEADHIHIAIENNSQNSFFKKPLSIATWFFCKSAIFLSKKL